LLVKRIESEGLAHFSYIVVEGSMAFVVDPRRDCEVYLEIARREGAQITHVFETHRNEDYVIGSMEIVEMTGAKVFHGPGLDFDYGETVIDGQVFSFGDLELRAIHTPGHTEESMSYVLVDLGTGYDPVAVFTGDALFVGDVGRTDLPGPDKQERLSHELYHSLQTKLVNLGDGTIVFPAHGSGSVCGGDISERAFSTIGLEKIQNPLLRLSEDEFVKNRMEQKLDRPPYFRRMEAMNLHKHLAMSGLPEPEALSPKQFRLALEQGGLLLDLRMPHSVAGAYIKGATSIWLDGLAAYIGWLFPYDKPIYLVVEDPLQVERAVRVLVRMGYDYVAGYLLGGMAQWLREGMPYETLPTMNVAATRKLVQEGKAMILDPRPGNEVEEVRVPGAKHVFIGELQSRPSEVPKLVKVACMCSAGFRGSMAAVMLRNMGYDNVFNVLGGIGAWKAAGFEIEE
jgi:hydroxyacylglutathione hydrolase